MHVGMPGDSCMHAYSARPVGHWHLLRHALRRAGAELRPPGIGQGDARGGLLHTGMGDCTIPCVVRLTPFARGVSLRTPLVRIASCCSTRVPSTPPRGRCTGSSCSAPGPWTTRLGRACTNSRLACTQCLARSALLAQHSLTCTAQPCMH